jgi:hypothetical protein
MMRSEERRGSEPDRPERFPAKWKPVRVKKTRQNTKIASRSSIGCLAQVPTRAGMGSVAFRFRRLPVRINMAPSTVNRSSCSE